MAVHAAFPGAAPALLASSLLQPSLKDAEDQTQGAPIASSWDLKPDIDIGVPICSGERSVFNPGRVVGISGLQPTMSRPQELRDGDEDESAAVRNWVLEVGGEFVLGCLMLMPLVGRCIWLTFVSFARDSHANMSVSAIYAYTHNASNTATSISNIA